MATAKQCDENRDRRIRSKRVRFRSVFLVLLVVAFGSFASWLSFSTSGLRLQFAVADRCKCSAWQLSICNRLLARLANNPDALTPVVNARISVSLTAIADSEESLNAILEKRPEDIEALLLRGKVRFFLQEYSSSTEDFSKALYLLDQGNNQAFGLSRNEIERWAKISGSAVSWAGTKSE